MSRSRTAGRIGRQLGLWVAVSGLAGLAIGLAVSVFQGGGVERPVLVISVLFANVVGLTAMVGSVWLFPRLRGRSGLLRFPLLVLALLSGAVLGSLAVLGAYPLFVFRELRLAVAVVAINSVLALVVGGVVLGYEEMRLRLQDTLREMREVRLVEARLREDAARAELAAPPRPDRVSVRRGAGILLLDLDEIVWFEAEDTLVFARTAAGRFLVDRTLAELEQQFEGQFFRAHRSRLVNLGRIAEIRPADAGTWTIVCPGAGTVPLSRRQARRLREIFPW